MNTICRMFTITCFSVAAFAGCAADQSPPAGTPDTEAASQTTVVRYTAADIAALPAGQLVQFDLTAPNTVYALTYTNAADLDRVLVIRSDGKYILGDQTPKAEGNALKQIALSGEDSAFEESVTCNCPCSQLVDGKLVSC